jgi:hypothetical protein
MKGKRQTPEADFQRKLVALLTYRVRRELIWMHSANGDLRNVLVAKRLKEMGVLPGVPDMCFLLDRGRTGWLELKAPGGRLTPEQRGFGMKSQKLGHYWGMASTMDEAMTILKAWGALYPDGDDDGGMAA